MEITAFGIYDWKTIKKYHHFHNFKRNKLKKASVPIVLIALIISFLGFLVCYILDGLDSTLITLLIVEIIAAFLLFFTWFIMPRISFNLNKLAKNNKNEYVFKDETFIAACKAKDISGSTEISYKKLNSIYETEDFLYIYISMNQAFIVEKASVSGGSLEELRTHLINNMKTGKYRFAFK